MLRDLVRAAGGGAPADRAVRRARPVGAALSDDGGGAGDDGLAAADDIGAFLAHFRRLGPEGVPGVVSRLAAGGTPELAWRNALGGLTFRIGDRWADLAIASMSLDWSVGPGHQDELFEAYGIEPDLERIRWYRALWDLES